MRLGFLHFPPRGTRPMAAAVLICNFLATVGWSPSAGVAANAERFDLETSDGVSLATWYYAPAADQAPLATVILVHDFEGSHKAVERLALALQKAGYAVAAPDLRGHGASTKQDGREKPLECRQLRKADLELMATGAGGRLRAQAAVRGDLETVYAFLATRGDTGPLVVVGCGAGAMLAALWTTADWAWPPLASGQQGQQVRALVLVSPTWSAKGLSLQPALTSDTLKKEVPVLVLAGTGDPDAIKLFEQLKRQRPRHWFDQRAEGEFTKGKDVEKPGDATLFLIQLDTTLSAEKLADDDGASARIGTFLSLTLDEARDR